MEEVDDIGVVAGPREEGGEAITKRGEGNPELFRVRTYPRKCRVSQIPQL